MGYPQRFTGIAVGLCQPLAVLPRQNCLLKIGRVHSKGSRFSRQHLDIADVLFFAEIELVHPAVVFFPFAVFAGVIPAHKRQVGIGSGDDMGREVV